ncbi:molybdopterin-dependent oxidoreductase [Actinacidiphila glaucinigra]|uniref:molybdopterin-dependent oxidoreductase n=1 Tax=Actinacidiphila glaucinigra TaxID=235986 RepID=UPI00370FB973
MASFSPGFRGRAHPLSDRLPPGQYPTESFPVLSTGPTPRIPPEEWTFTLTTEQGEKRSWTWDEMMAMPQDDITTDIHCVTRWSKFDTRWRGVPIEAFLENVDTTGHYARAHSYGGYSTNFPVEDLLNAWIVHTYEGYALSPEHGGPARLLMPHLYLWKSAKWVRGLDLTQHDEPGFWESGGYHNYGDPWREQRRWNDPP